MTRRLYLRIRVDKDQRLATLEHVLVDRELRGVGQMLGVNHHQHVDFGGDRIDVGRQRLDVDDLAQLADDRLRLARPALQGRKWIAVERQRTEQPDDRALGKRKRVDQPGQIVFEKPLPLGIEERDRLLIVGRIGAGEPEINRLSLIVERHGLQPISNRAVLCVGKRQRVIDFEAELALRRGDVLVEQLAHALRVNAISGRVIAKPVRVIKAQRDRFVDLGQRLARTASERIEMFRGQIEPQRGVTPNQDIARDEDQRDRDERYDRTGAGRAEAVHHSAFIKSISTAFAARNATMIETK